jgi:L-ascorbate metabolism protein UlaG (beta-lactamase superfamily)
MSIDRPSLLDHLHWIGHDAFRLDQPIVIYIDPWRLPAGSPLADLILVSHDHHDHCSPADIALVRTTATTVIANPTAAAKIAGEVTILRAGENLRVGPVTISAIAAYNHKRHFHPKEAGHLGFLLHLGEEKLYFAGDTDFIPEMESLDCDVALLPVSGTYVMTAQEAVEAARAIAPRVAIPMHYGAGVAGTIQDAELFRQLSPVPVLLLDPERAD